MNKRFIRADDLLRDSFQLAANVHAAGFKPDFLVGLWRGGSAVGIRVRKLHKSSLGFGVVGVTHLQEGSAVRLLLSFRCD